MRLRTGFSPRAWIARFDRTGDLVDPHPIPDLGDPGFDGVPDRPPKMVVPVAAAHFDRFGGVRDRPVEVRPHVDLEEVARLERRLVLGGRSVVRRLDVAGEIRGKAGSAPACRIAASIASATSPQALPERRLVPPRPGPGR